MGHILRKHVIEITFWSDTTNGVYEAWTEIVESYIQSEKLRLASTRIAEHIAATKNRNIESSEAEYLGDHVRYEDAMAQIWIQEYKQRVVQEVIDIKNKTLQTISTRKSFKLLRTNKPQIVSLTVSKDYSETDPSTLSTRSTSLEQSNTYFSQHQVYRGSDNAPSTRFSWLRLKSTSLRLTSPKMHLVREAKCQELQFI